MNLLRFVLILLLFLSITSGCSDDASIDSEVKSPASAKSTVKPEAHHVAEFVHQFPEGKENGNGASGGLKPEPVDGQPFYGFDDANYSSETSYKGKEKSVNFRMKLVDHRNGKDIYEITRSVSVTETDGNRSTETEGVPTTVTVEYAGEELTIFDDEHGISKFIPQSPNATTK